jgi:Cell Wall Hydrolase
MNASTRLYQPPQRSWRRRGFALSIRLAVATSLALIVAGLTIVSIQSWLRWADESASSGDGRVRVSIPLLSPTDLLPVGPKDAETINAAVPFANAPLVRATPVRLTGGGGGIERARDCLAAAAWYEAGDDTSGERSVAQVVINRLAHPAFPKSVCGVVFQGSDRTTGCQFTFTCDGSLIARRPSETAWRRAQAIAQLALSGVVDPKVGLATHYHTDWVVPRWSQSLDKIAKVGTHLFFKFRGKWGAQKVLRAPRATNEALVTKLAGLSESHRASPDLRPPATSGGEHEGSVASGLIDRGANYPQEATRGTLDLKGHSLAFSDPAAGLYVLRLSAMAPPGTHALAALAVCRGKEKCSVLAWRDGQPMPQDAAHARSRSGLADFAYTRIADGKEKLQWNCQAFVRPSSDQCLARVEPPPVKAKASEGVAVH